MGDTKNIIRCVPIYDYRCDACGHAFSAVQAMTDAPLERCPQCGARPRRVPSRPAIVFKGSGWHITDYRKEKASAAGSGDDTGSKPAEKPDTGKKASAEHSSEGKSDKPRDRSAKSDDAAAAN
jgi:putative FmdB family regulatory protein